MKGASLTACAALALSLSGCGYHLAHGAYGAADPMGPFTVIAGPAQAPEAAASSELEAGARAELSRAGALGGSGSSLEVTVLRVDESAEGIGRGAGAPIAGAVRVTVVGRGRVLDGSRAARRDTGDVGASEVVSRPLDAASWIMVREEASRAAARRLGETLARRALGLPSPSEP